jgi:hypothetical protein
MTHITLPLDTIRILFRAPDSLQLFGIPYEMDRTIGQEPRHLWIAARERNSLSRPSMVGPSPTAGWIYIAEDEPDMLAWLSTLDDVPQNPCEWCECKPAIDPDAYCKEHGCPRATCDESH